MLDFSQGQDWVHTGLALLIGLPIAVVIASEISFRLNRAGQTEASETILFLRNFCLPLLFLVVLLRQVAELSPTSTIVRVVETVFWISVINAGLAALNLVVFGGWLASKKRAVPKLFLDLIRVFFVLIGAAVVVSTIWRVDLGGLLTALGVGSVVIGLALQDTLGNLFAGIALLFARHFKDGDWVRIGDKEGVVVGTDWRSVTIRTRVGEQIIIPNSVLGKGQFTNISAAGDRFVIVLEIDLAYAHPPEFASRMLVEAARRTPGVFSDPSPTARVWAFGDYAVRYRVIMHYGNYQDRPKIETEFRAIFWYIAERNGLVFPASHNRDYRTFGTAAPAQRKGIELARMVARTGAFARPADLLEPLMEHARHVRYRNGENIVVQGTPADGCYVLLAGRAVVSYAPIDKPSVQIDALKAGQIVIFKALFRHAPSPYTVKADGDVEAVWIGGADLVSFLTSDKALATELEDIISAREQRAHRVLSESLPAHRNGNMDESRVRILEELFKR